MVSVRLTVLQAVVRIASKVGFVRIVDRQECESGRKKFSVMRPFMADRFSEKFDPAMMFEGKLEEMRTSCV